MSAWLAALPVGLVCAVLVLLPGLLLGYAAGLRSLAAWATAPVLTVALIASAGVVTGTLGLGWSIPLVLGVVVLAAAVIAGGSWLLRRVGDGRIGAGRFRTRLLGDRRLGDGRLRRRLGRSGPVDSPAVRTAVLAGLGAAVLVGGVTVVLGLRRPDQVSQTFDAVFHYNAVAWILDSRDASSLTMNALGTVDLPAGFYPAAWHDLTSLLVLGTGSSILVATNAMSAVVAVLVWPLGCLLLVRQVFGPSRAALVVTGVLSVGFTAFPWGMLAFGVLWPNLLAMALLPAGLAVVLSISGLAVDDVLGRGRAWLLLPVVLVAETLAQTNTVFGLAVLSAFPVGAALLRRAFRLARDGRAARGWAEVAGALLLAGAGWWWTATTPALARVRTQYWPPYESPAQAVGQVLLNATRGPINTNGFDALWVLSVLVVIGLVLAARRPGQRWLVAGYACTAALFVLTAAINRPDTQKFTGYWYNDAYRLGALLPVTTVPLAVAATVYLGRRLHRAFLDWKALGGKGFPVLDRPVFRSAVVPVLVVLVLLGIGSKGLYLGDRVQTLTFRRTEALAGKVNTEGWLVDPRARAFFTRIAPLIPKDAVVADNPWDGSALLWAVADRRTLFPHVGLNATPDELYLAAHLDDVATDPKVCPIARHLHVRYLLLGDGNFWSDDGRRKDYAGLANPVGRPGFRLLDADGPLLLFQVTAC